MTTDRYVQEIVPLVSCLHRSKAIAEEALAALITLYAAEEYTIGSYQVAINTLEDGVLDIAVAIDCLEELKNMEVV